jgi:hypothetical protein
MPVMACPRCGHVRDVTEDSPYCPRCGQLIPVGSQAAPGSSASLRVADASGVRAPGSSSSIPIPHDSAVTPPPPPREPASGEHLVRRLKVIDGADQGHSFLVPDEGIVSVGSSSKHAEICLHDLYVSRVHCQLQAEDDHLLVTSLDASRPTYVNGAQIHQQSLVPGDVLRVGNSYLRLELEVAAELMAVPRARPGSSASVPAPAKATRLPLNRLGELAGQMVGHFQLEKVVGAGHFGVVFRARDLKGEQDVALKVFAPEFPANDIEMQHFVLVMRTAVPLRHAGLVGIHGAGKSGAYCWLSRELVHGVSLAQMLHPSGKSREGIDWRLALRVAVHIGQALEVIHQNHLMHGNVTPQNILLEGKEGQAKLNDLLMGRAFENTVLGLAVKEAKFQADLPYLAPEQTEAGAFVDNLCDVYSLGVVVYALMTGRLPFRAKTTEELLQQIREEIPAKPKKFERSIPTRFQEIVLKMLAKRQEDRYATPGELLADLDEIVKQRDVAV